MHSELRICFLGDQLVAGRGDRRALGWTGRLLVRTQLNPMVTHFELAVPYEPLHQMSKRWESELLLRHDRAADNRLVIGIGIADVEQGISNARSRLSLANILDGAAAWDYDCFVVGPPPLPGPDLAAIESLSNACSEVCRRRSIPYIETFAPLVGNEQWAEDIRQYGMPGQSGYGLLAYLALHGGWHQWLGLPEA